MTKSRCAIRLALKRLSISDSLRRWHDRTAMPAQAPGGRLLDYFGRHSRCLDGQRSRRRVRSDTHRLAKQPTDDRVAGSIVRRLPVGVRRGTARGRAHRRQESVEESRCGAQWASGDRVPTANGAIYFSRIKASDPLRENRTETFAPSGGVAGVIARTDAARGIWKAPAGLQATLVGVDMLGYTLNDVQNGRLNARGVNCLRRFPNVGPVVWGARTLLETMNAGRSGSTCRCGAPRLYFYIEESLVRGTQWVVSEPNDEPLWAQIRLNVGDFMNQLFGQGAFQGRTPRESVLRQV